MRLAGCFAAVGATLVLSGFPAVVPASLSAQTPLGRLLDRRLDTAPLNRFLWGVAIVDDRGRLLYGRNPELLFVPASAAKLFVGAVAAATLPPDGTVRTSVYATGPATNGIVQGDLVLYGRGDPTMDRRCYGLDTTQAFACQSDPAAPLHRLADSLKTLGIRGIAGDVIGDGSWLEPTTVHPAWEAYDLNWWYAAPVSGLGFNDNSVDIVWSPGNVGEPARITFLPKLGDVTLENRTVVIAGDTGGTLDFFRDPGTLRIRAEGRVAQGAAGGTEHFALPDPNLYTAWAFAAALADVGVALHGGVRSTTDSSAYRAARAGSALAEVESRPFRDWIFPVLNSSQNWFAEMLLKQIGRRSGRGGSWSEGLAVERRFLVDSAGIDSTQFLLVDASGLSWLDRVTPRALVGVLQFAHRHAGMDAFHAALPRSGSRGSLRRRFLGTPLDSLVAAKPGSLTGANSLAGYLDLATGKRITFAIVVNHHTLGNGAMAAVIDSLVLDIARGLGGRR
jgi:D-alanyl-D-alanine carboxypeptidase/D-alanyl-D-alanine-endopeptidase (penicillin-binding protein 4)